MQNSRSRRASRQLQPDNRIVWIVDQGLCFRCALRQSPEQVHALYSRLFLNWNPHLARPSDVISPGDVWPRDLPHRETQMGTFSFDMGTPAPSPHSQYT